MDTRTTYLGLPLANPFMPGASPLADDIDVVLALEDAGAAAIVMRSLFEEQIVRRRYGYSALSSVEGSRQAEALACFPEPEEYAVGPDRYLELLHRIKRRVDIPVIASLNGTTPEGWLEYGRLIQQAGADAVELNFYHLATDPLQDAAAVERNLIDIVAVLQESIRLPLAVKLTPFHSALPNLAARLETLGVAGLILFNRFYQPDIDPSQAETVARLELSNSSELLLRLRWLAILSGQVKGSLAVSGGVHQPIDAVKAVMAGADGIQVVSALLRKGPKYLGFLKRGFERWCTEHGYLSIGELRDTMSLARSADPHASERGNYLRILQSHQN